jgi:hypothetical protein
MLPKKALFDLRFFARRDIEKLSLDVSGDKELLFCPEVFIVFSRLLAIEFL